MNLRRRKVCSFASINGLDKISTREDTEILIMSPNMITSTYFDVFLFIGLCVCETKRNAGKHQGGDTVYEFSI